MVALLAPDTELDVMRFDRGAISVVRGQLSSELIDDDIRGFLKVPAIYCRDGILTYVQPDGSVRKEFRPPEENADILSQLRHSPVTLEHPPEFVTWDNAEKYQVGVTDEHPWHRDGYVGGNILLYPRRAIEAVTSGQMRETSMGYNARLLVRPGTYKGERYDSVQTRLTVNHNALTRRARAGADSRVYLDYFDSLAPPSESLELSVQRLDDREFVDLTSYLSPEPTPTQPTMRTTTVTVHRGDSSTAYTDVPTEFATYANELSERVDSLGKEKNALSSQLSAERDRADALATEVEALTEELQAYNDEDDRLIQAETIVQELGCTWNADSRAWEAPDHFDMEEEEDDEDEEESGPPAKFQFKKGNKKGGKHDSADAVGDRVQAWREAELLLGPQKYDSALTTSQIHEEVVRVLRPDLDLSRYDAAQVEALYDSICAEEMEYLDEAEVDAENREDMGGRLRRSHQDGDPYDQVRQTIESAHLEPIGFAAAKA